MEYHYRHAKGKGKEVYSLISSLKIYHPTVYWTCIFVCHFNSMKSIQSCSHLGALNLSYTLPSLSYHAGTHWNQSHVKHLRVNCLAQGNKHPNNVPTFRGEKHHISLKIQPRVGFQLARQAAATAKRQALAITPRPSLMLLSIHEEFCQLVAIKYIFVVS